MQMPWMKIAIIVVAFSAGYLSFTFTRQPDGVIEQAAEAVLKTQGVDIDFSPNK